MRAAHTFCTRIIFPSVLYFSATYGNIEIWKLPMCNICIPSINESSFYTKQGLKPQFQWDWITISLWNIRVHVRERYIIPCEAFIIHVLWNVNTTVDIGYLSAFVVSDIKLHDGRKARSRSLRERRTTKIVSVGNVRFVFGSVFLVTRLCRQKVQRSIWCIKIVCIICIIDLCEYMNPCDSLPFTMRFCMIYMTWRFWCWCGLLSHYDNERRNLRHYDR